MRAPSLIPTLILPMLMADSCPARAEAEQIAWGSPASGIRLGLSLSPRQTVIPSELTVIVTLHNTTTQPKTIPISICGTLSWPSYGKLMVRVDGGRTYRLRLQGSVDITSIHDHGPLQLAAGQRIEAKLSFAEMAQFLPDEDAELGLAERLLSARQIELWAELAADTGGLKVASGHLQQRLVLTPLAQPLGTACIAQFATSTNQACALNRVGTPHCWGDTAPGWDPDAKRMLESRPKPVVRLQRGVKTLGFGNSELCAITTDSGVLCLHGGNNSESVKQIVNPQRIGGLPSDLSTLWLGIADQCVQTTAGELWCWGRNQSATSGGIAVTSREAKRLDALGNDVAEVAIGWQHACARTRSGSVLCWGENKVGQLGSGNLLGSETPIRVDRIGGTVTKVVSGTSYSCALRSDGKVYCWGKDPYGAIGSNISTEQVTPFECKELGSEVVDLFAANNQTCALTRSGSLLCSGVVALREGLLSTKTPVPIDSIPTDIAEVTIGSRDACARMRSGTVWCWGETLRAMAAPGAPRLPNGATQVVGLTEIASVHVGNSFFCARAKSGAVSCWGDGSGGQLGAGRLNMTTRPVRIAIPCGE